MKATTRERPVIMSAESVRAILAGTKTQTRRVYKPRNPEPWELPPGEGYLTDGTPWPMRQDEYGDFWPIPCPYGAPSDRLWVKEAFAVVRVFPGGHGDYGEHRVVGPLGGDQDDYRRIYAADEREDGPWRSPLMMPRWASRLTLEVVSRRIERVQEITLSDIEAEGVPDDRATFNEPKQRATFAAGWDAINAKRGFGWDTNPWVWVVTFRRIDR